MSFEVESSLDLALADIELLCSAYPDEVAFVGNGCSNSLSSSDQSLPLTVTLHLSDDALVDFQFDDGYPKDSAIKVTRCRSSKEYPILQAAIRAFERTALECMQEGIEGALPCCAAAFEAWNSAKEDQKQNFETPPTTILKNQSETIDDQKKKSTVWVSGEPLIDRKSTFQAHLCHVHSEHDVQEALRSLNSISNKIARATHNMVRFDPHTCKCI